jgi:hypothetical protein
MKKLVKHVGVLRASIIAAIIYGVIGVVIVPFLFLMWAVDPPEGGFGMAAVVAFFMPVFYAGLGFVSTAFFCFLYNVLSSKLGGIEVTLIDAPEALEAPVPMPGAIPIG